MKKVYLVFKKSTYRVSQVSGDLLHPVSMDPLYNPSNFDFPNRVIYNH